MSDNWWGLIWVLCGIPFALVCTAQGRREHGTWAWAIAGFSIAFMFGPISLLLIAYTPDDEIAAEETA